MMSAALETNIKETPVAEIQRVFKLQQSNQFKLAATTAKERKAKLEKLLQALYKYRPEIKEAGYNDFRRHPSESDLIEAFPIIKEIKFAKSNIKSWMRPRRVSTPPNLIGSSSHIRHEPKGLVLIVSPWNFPFHLTLGPLVCALAAGNAVILKPSEYTPHATELMKKIVSEVFEEQEVALIEGGIPTSTALLELPFNHIYFTGSPTVGKIVMQAAAKNLASVTLELGGKSPVIVDETASVETAARRIVWAKYANTGQICLTPDHIFVHKSKKQEFVNEVKKRVLQYFSEDPSKEPSFGRMVDNRHYQKVSGYLKDALDKGATVEIGGRLDSSDNYIEPTVLTNVSMDSALMQNEIFGPILPILEFDNLSEVLETINSKEKPLALYIYSSSKKNINHILDNTRAGGGCINHCNVHYFNNNLPYGGVNNSGIGKAHGKHGFESFSNARGILKQHIPNALDMLLPPYDDFKNKMIAFIVRYL